MPGRLGDSLGFAKIDLASGGPNLRLEACQLTLVYVDSILLFSTDS